MRMDTTIEHVIQHTLIEECIIVVLHQVNTGEVNRNNYVRNKESFFYRGVGICKVDVPKDTELSCLGVL